VSVSSAETPKSFLIMPAITLRQMCDGNEAGCKVYIGGAASALYYTANGSICFPVETVAGFRTIDLGRIIQTARHGLEKVSLDEEAVEVMTSVWKAEYPCR